MHAPPPHSASATHARQVIVDMSQTGAAAGQLAPVAQLAASGGGSPASPASQVGGVTLWLQNWPVGQSPVVEHGTPTAADGL